uniref:Uncharacterized protein n=1 Tax=Anopheles albimanus TaxID=7167 RepID=A0A8W7K923_ANOAL
MEYESFVQNLDKVSSIGDRCPPESPYSQEFERRMGALMLNFDLDGNPTTATAVATENDGLSSEEYDVDSGVGSFDEGRDDRDDQSSSKSDCSRLKKSMNAAMCWTASTGEDEPTSIAAPYGINCLFSLEGSPVENQSDARSIDNNMAHPHKRTHGRCNDREEDVNSKDALMAKMRKLSGSPTKGLSSERFTISQWSRDLE